MLDRQRTVASVVLEHSACAEVFQRHRIDFCCRGELSLEVAAQANRVDVDALVGELSSALARRQSAPSDPTDPGELSTPALVAELVLRHHRALRTALPMVQKLAVKVARVHGHRVPDLVDLEAAVRDLAALVVPRLDAEEQRLFPALLGGATPDRGALKGELDAMVDGHRAVAGVFERLRSTSGGFALPDWACNSYRALFSELRQLERDASAHARLEAEVLGPRFAAAAPGGAL